MSKSTSPTFKQNWRDLLSVGGLVGAVLATLILGAALQADAPATDDESGRTVIDRRARPLTEPLLPAPTTIEHLPTDSAAVPRERPAGSLETGDVVEDLSGDDGLARRALLDPRRLADSAGGWTLQFMFTCLPETAEQVVNGVGSDSRLHLLPKLQDDRPCFRICWGSYTTRDQALAAADIPAALLQLTREPLARQIDDLLR